MSDCDFSKSLTCPACGFVAKDSRVRRNCKTQSICKPGCQLSKLLATFGITYTSECGCKSHAAEMDRWGVEGCLENMTTILGWMREEAEKRGAWFVESQARWLIELAYTLAEEDREPNKLEWLRLRAMRIGNKILNQVPQAPASARSTQ